MLIITQEQLDALLNWFSDDPEIAGEKYESIRAGLVRVFISKGFSDAEDLADEVINRVAVRLSDIRETYEGEQARYFHGVARYVLREAGRRREITAEVSAVWIEPQPSSEEYECLQHCLRLLPEQKRELILDYYLYEGHEKVEHHKQMAADLEISEGALRGRVHHIRVMLENCAHQCAGGKRVTKLDPQAIVRRGAIGGRKPSINTETIN